MKRRKRHNVVARVEDSTLPSVETAPKGIYVAVVGPRNNGDVPVWDEALGYCVWGAGGGGSSLDPVTVSDGAGGFLIVFDNDGNVVYA